MLSLALAHESIHSLIDLIPGVETLYEQFGWLGNTFIFGTHITLIHVITSLIATVCIVILGLASWKKFKPTPDAKLTPRTIFELAIDALLGLLEGQIHDKEKARKYLPLILGLAVFLFVNNLFALIPGFSPATDNLNTNVGMALIVFVVSVVAGIRAKGFGHYLAEFCGPIRSIKGLPLMILMFPIELIGQIVRPITLTIRLMGNMFGDHAIVAILLALCAPFVPAVMMTLGVLVVFIQTVVFCMLSVVYISMSIAEE